jgi:hypothetical protein
MLPKPAKRFAKPRFDDLLKHYNTDPETVHTCAILNPTAEADGINTCAARMSEALVLANALVTDRAKIKAGARRGDDYPLLGPYSYKLFGNLCNHGIARGARDLGEFLGHHWGSHKELSGLTEAPPSLEGKRGVVCFVKIPGYDGQGHIDLWNKTEMVGHGYWDSSKIWFFELT